MTIVELREKRANAIEEARRMIDVAEEENRSLTDEETAEYDRYLEEAGEYKASIERKERLEEEERDLEASRGRIVTRTTTTTESDEFLRSWLNGDEGREFTFSLRSEPYDGGDVRKWEQRAQSFAATEGGELVPEGFVSQLEVALAAFGGVRGAASILRTASGNDLPWPTVNDTTNKGELIGVNAARTEQDIVTGETVFKAFTFSSKAIRVPFELLQDSGVDLAAELGSLLGERIARIQSEYFTTGTGSSQPEGVVTGAAAGPTQATLGAVTYDELIDIEHSVDPAYRAGAVFMFNDSTLKELKKLKDSQGNPIFVPGNISEGAPATVLGYRYIINQDMDGLDVASGRSIVFGDVSKYKVREVLGVRLIRLDERYADNGQVGFMAHARADGRLLDAGTNPVKAFVNAAA